MPSKTCPPPRVVIFAGPNGAGKSTHADAILAALGIETFVNADYIARGLSGRHTEAVAFEAGRIMLKRLRQLSKARADFAFESTLSSRTFAVFLRLLKAQGYAVAIYYFSLANAQLAIRRVKLRVALGGHDVPPDVVR
jgi:predicted ABC-type ATPase